jgi:hypothetical protein
MRASIVVTLIAGSLFAASMSVLVNPRSAPLVAWLTDRPASVASLPLPDLNAPDAATLANGLPTDPPAGPGRLTLPAGTVIRGLLQFSLGSAGNRAGDNVTLSVTEPVAIDGAIAIPRGASILAVVTEARSATAGRGTGFLTLSYRSVTDIDGRMHRLKARHLRTSELLPLGTEAPGEITLEPGTILEVRLEAPLELPAGAGRFSS